MEKFPEIHDLAHSIMMTASKCKQDLDRQNGVDLIESIIYLVIFFALTILGVTIVQFLRAVCRRLT